MGDLDTVAKKNAFINYLWEENKARILEKDDFLQRKKLQYQQSDKKVENWRDEIKTENDEQINKLDTFLKAVGIKDIDGNRKDNIMPLNQ